jgi:hypothetical protein
MEGANPTESHTQRKIEAIWESVHRLSPMWGRTDRPLDQPAQGVDLMARPSGTRGVQYVAPLMLDRVRYHISEDIYRITVCRRFNSCPGAHLFLADPDSPTCPVCGGHVRASDEGRFLYYRRIGTPMPWTRFTHGRCLRDLPHSHDGGGDGMGASWVPNYGELGSVF